MKLPKRIQRYLEIQGASCKPSTVGGYRTNLGHFCHWLGAQYPSLPFRQRIHRLTKPGLQEYMAHLNTLNLVPYTRVNYLLSVKKYLAWEVDRGNLKGDLLDVLDRKNLPKVPEYLPRPLSPENDRFLEEKLKNSTSPYAPLFLLLRQTGMRISELINLPKDCVVTTPKQEHYLKVPLGKMNTERLVPLSGESLELVESLKKAPPIRLKRRDPDRLIGLKGPVSSVYRLLDHRFKKLLQGMTDQNKPITFHRLRHTYATTLLTGGVGLVSLMKLLGHRRIEMTLRYAKVTPSHLRNEYLKALRILESQSLPDGTQSLAAQTASLHPAQLIAQLIAFLIKAATLKDNQKKNILRRLRKLHKVFSHTHFSQKFNLDLTREDKRVRWAG